MASPVDWAEEQEDDDSFWNATHDFGLPEVPSSAESIGGGPDLGGGAELEKTAKTASKPAAGSGVGTGGGTESMPPSMQTTAAVAQDSSETAVDHHVPRRLE